MSDISHKSLAISLNNFKYKNGVLKETEISDDDSDLFVGRTSIIAKIVDLLRHTKRGSYLIAGYRGVGKTYVINRAISEYNSSSKRPVRKQVLSRLLFTKPKKAIVINVNLGENRKLRSEDIYYSITNILLDEISKVFKQTHSLIYFVSAFLLTAISFFYLILPLIHHSIKVKTYLNDLATYVQNLWVIGAMVFAIPLSYLFFGGLYYRKKILGKLRILALRMQFEISHGKNLGSNTGWLNFGASRNLKYLPLQTREIEYQLKVILEELCMRKKTTKTIRRVSQMNAVIISPVRLGLVWWRRCSSDNRRNFLITL